jgi:glycosyltransferase involved in cell wall biosynthesis
VSILQIVVPDGIDDPARPSGGNAYDRHLIDGLEAHGFAIEVSAVPGTWPVPDVASVDGLAACLADMADGSVVLIDGLVASASSSVLGRHASRLRLVVLMHMPLGSQPVSDVSVHANEHASMTAATAVIATSTWTRRWLITHYALPPEKVHVAEPGVEPSEVAPGSSHGGRFICVGAVVPHKGHDILVEALARLAQRDWDCRLVGASEIDRGFVAGLRRRIHASGLEDRIRFVGPRTGHALAKTYATADLLIVASRVDTYGMVVTEALARGTPVVATAVGGLPSTLGVAGDSGRPGMLVPPDDPAQLADALTDWLDHAPLRRRLRSTALERRRTLGRWSDTSHHVARVLQGVAA